VLAVEPSEVLPDPAMEARARALSTGLRCLVCRNQSIDDSNAELARDLRVLLRERLVAGDTDEQAVDYLVSRYGNYILLKPPFAATTVVLWLGPALLLLVAFLGFRTLWSGKRRPDDALPDEDMTEEDRALIARTLAAKDA
jgi:cytochrome c-type biogenesis protein CcmH